MKKLALLSILLLGIIVLPGCDKSHNFMDIDNPHAEDDFRALFGSGNTGSIIPKDIIPDSLSGTVKDVKGYAHKYYEDTVEQYVDKAKVGLSGAVKSLKDYYNSGVDQITNTINDKVTGTISGELNKIKL